MEITAISVKDAEAFLKKHDRHYRAPAEAICAIGVSEVVDTCDEKKGDVRDADGDYWRLHGAVILGRRKDGDAELAHIYCDGVSQGYSLLYGAAWRTLKSLGYKRAVL